MLYSMPMKSELRCMACERNQPQPITNNTQKYLPYRIDVHLRDHSTEAKAMNMLFRLRKV